MKDTDEMFVVSIMSKDRVGIVYEVSKAMSELSGNISDIRQSVLCGYFTMILLVSFPNEVKKRDIERKLAEIDAQSETPIDTVVKEADKESVMVRSSYPDNTYVLTATGEDKIGFVATVSSFCVDNHINILDLSTTESNGEYIMILMMDLSKSGPVKQVRSALKQFADKSGIKMVLQHNHIFKAINEIRLPIG